MENSDQVWKCPKESCNNQVINIKRNQNIIETGTWREITIHILEHLNQNVIYFGPSTIEKFLEDGIEDLLVQEDKQLIEYERREGAERAKARDLTWKNRMRSALAQIKIEGYIETDKSSDDGTFQAHYRSRRRTEKFFNDLETYDDWSDIDIEGENILFCRNGWMRYYKGISDDDIIVRGGSHIEEYNYGSEILNFKPTQGYYYGFVQANSDTIDITRLGASRQQESIEGINVVWGATSESGGQMIYGWYRNATVFRKRQTPSDDLNRSYDGNIIYFNIRAKIEDCHLLPEEERNFEVPLAKEKGYGFGMSNVWYAEEEEAKEFRNKVLKYINETYSKHTERSNDKIKKIYKFPERKLLSSDLLSSEELDNVKELLLKHKQIIFYGPPGTGKTYFAQIIAQELTNNKYEIIQFHPSYAYEDFVEWIEASPSKDGNNVIFKAQPRIFRSLCNYALNSSHDVVLIIDEINRGDIGRIFGELILGLEVNYRNMEISTPLANKLGSLKIPDNLYIIGSMNSVDRSIAIMDYALRRRFLFYLLMPNKEILIRYINDINIGLGEELKKKILNLFTHLNEKISNERKLGKHYQIGHTYFFVKSEEELKTNWSYMIKPLLEEYFNFNEEDLSVYNYDDLIQESE